MIFTARVYSGSSSYTAVGKIFFFSKHEMELMVKVLKYNSTWAVVKGLKVLMEKVVMFE